MAERPKPKEARFPKRIAPMIPIETRRLPAKRLDWICEVKWNGIRAVAYIPNPQNITIRSITGRDVTDSFPELVSNFSILGERCSMILDGEIVAGDGKTIQDRKLAQERTHLGAKNARFISRTNPCQFVIFDILFLGDINLTTLTLDERKEKLQSALAKVNIFGVTANLLVRRNFGPFVESIRKAGYEGVVFKRRKSPYKQSLRPEKTAEWLAMDF